MVSNGMVTALRLVSTKHSVSARLNKLAHCIAEAIVDTGLRTVIRITNAFHHELYWVLHHASLWCPSAATVHFTGENNDHAEHTAARWHAIGRPSTNHSRL